MQLALPRLKTGVPQQGMQRRRQRTRSSASRAAAPAALCSATSCSSAAARASAAAECSAAAASAAAASLALASDASRSLPSSCRASLASLRVQHNLRYGAPADCCSVLPMVLDARTEMCVYLFWRSLHKLFTVASPAQKRSCPPRATAVLPCLPPHPAEGKIPSSLDTAVRLALAGAGRGGGGLRV